MVGKLGGLFPTLPPSRAGLASGVIGIKGVVLCTVSKCFFRLQVVFRALDNVLLLGPQSLQ